MWLAEFLWRCTHFCNPPNRENSVCEKFAPPWKVQNVLCVSQIGQFILVPNLKFVGLVIEELLLQNAQNLRAVLTYGIYCTIPEEWVHGVRRIGVQLKADMIYIYGHVEGLLEQKVCSAYPASGHKRYFRKSGHCWPKQRCMATKYSICTIPKEWVLWSWWVGAMVQRSGCYAPEE